MAYVVTENCLKCKFTDCVEVCPVDCFYEGKNMLVINPDECIDCGVCEQECPAGAIQRSSADNLKWQEINREFSQRWPNITEAKSALPDAHKHQGEADKFQKYFAEEYSK